MIDVLSQPLLSPFTVVYDITTKYGGFASSAEYTFDPARGSAVLIEDILYVFPTDSSEVTCSWSEESLTAKDCSPGIDETRVSHLQLNSRVFKLAIVDRLRRDAQVASGESTSRQVDIAERPATCVDIPVIDGNGSQQTKVYCAYSDIGVVASLDTADLAINAVFVDGVATTGMFEVVGK